MIGKKKVALQIAVAALLPLTMIGSATAADSVDVVLYAPSDLKGVPALPFTGENIKFTDPITGVKALAVTTMQGPAGTAFTISGSDLAPNTELALTWSTAKGAWKAQLLPNSVNYTGYQWDKFHVILAKVTTDASGAFKVVKCCLPHLQTVALPAIGRINDVETHESELGSVPYRRDAGHEPVVYETSDEARGVSVPERQGVRQPWVPSFLLGPGKWYGHFFEA